MIDFDLRAYKKWKINFSFYAFVDDVRVIIHVISKLIAKEHKLASERI